jgi:hypothetical protein
VASKLINPMHGHYAFDGSRFCTLNATFHRTSMAAVQLPHQSGCMAQHLVCHCCHPCVWYFHATTVLQLHTCPLQMRL